MLIDRPNPYRTAPPARLALDREDFGFEISTANEAALGRTAAWAVVAYLSADCNLAPQLFDDLLEMKGVGSSPEVHVSAWFNGPLLTDAFYARLNRDSRLGEDLVLRFTDMRFNKNETLTMALQVAQAFPARCQVLFLGGHGAGWRGALLDENRSAAYVNRPERLQLPAPYDECLLQLGRHLQRAQARIRQALPEEASGRRIDLLAFDACDMGCIEALAVFGALAGILVVSQNQVAGDGYPYEKVLQDLQAGPRQTPPDLARALVAQTKRRYLLETAGARAEAPGEMRAPAAPQPVVTQVALASDAFAAFVAAFVQLVRLMRTPAFDERVFEAARHAFAEVFTFEDTGNIDVVGFVQLLREKPLPDDVRVGAAHVLMAWERAVIASAVPGGARAMNGLSIHAPRAGALEPAYCALMADHPSGLGEWAGFLAGHHAAQADRQSGRAGG
jgi:hypothetical protein